MSTIVSVLAIETTVGKGSTFRVVDQDGKRYEYISASAVVQAALLAAFVTDSSVPLVIESGAFEIRRVEAFESARRHPRNLEGRYRVNRIATQRVSGVDHLEAFLVDLRQGPDSEKAYNIFDPLLTLLLTTAFASVDDSPGMDPIPVSAKIVDNDIVSARISRREE